MAIARLTQLQERQTNSVFLILQEIILRFSLKSHNDGMLVVILRLTTNGSVLNVVLVAGYYVSSHLELLANGFSTGGTKTTT